jgi:hypothetical protein
MEGFPMTTEAQPNESQTTTTQSQAQGEPTFAEYEAARRSGKSIEQAAQSKSAPAEKPEQKKSKDSDTLENEEEAEVKDASADEDGEESDESKDEAKDKPRKKGGFQRRIDKLNSAKADAQREAEYWKRLALEKQGAGEPKPAAKVETKASQEGKPDPDKFETHIEYVEALADWKIEQREKVREQESAKAKLLSEHQQALKAHSERVQSFAEKMEDFQDVLESVDDVPVSPAVQELIVSSENGPELMYELAKNRAEFERINKLSPLAAARELGRLESKLGAQSSAKEKPEPKKLTNAPKPLEPVGSGKGAVRKSISDPDISFAEYEQRRREQMRRRR